MKIGRGVYLGVPAAALAGLILFAYFSYRHELGAAQARVSSGSEIVDTPCGPIEYALIGKGAPVLLVHGAGGGFDQGLEFGRPLAEKGFPTPVRHFENASGEEQARILRIARGTLPVSQRRKGLWNDLAILASLPRYPLERIAAPTLVISIEDDLFGIYPGSRSAAEHIPGARFVSFPTGGHLWVGRQSEVASVLTTFLNRSAGAEPARPQLTSWCSA